MTQRLSPVIVATGLAFETAIVRRIGGARLCCGQGGFLVEALETAACEGTIRGVLSFGIAGGLDPALRPGAVVVASEILTERDRWTTDEAWSKALIARCPDGASAALLGVDRPVAKCAEKTRLFATTEAAAVDTESHRVARFAANRNVPFAVLRVVADPADGTIPAAANRAVRPDGTTNVAVALRALAARPADIPAMCALAYDTAQARRTLLRAGRRLGPGFAFVDIG